MDNIWTRLLLRFVHLPSLCQLIGQNINKICTLFVCFFLATCAWAQNTPLTSHKSCQIFVEELNHIREAAQLSCEGVSLYELNACFQKNWLRRGERYNLQSETPYAEAVLGLFSRYPNLFNPLSLKPDAPKHFKTLVLFGSIYSDQLARLQHAVELSQQGVTFERIVALGSTRPLDPKKEIELIARGVKQGDLMTRHPGDGPLPQTEASCWEYIFAHSELPSHWPSPVVLNTEALPGQARARTEDTIRDLLADPQLKDGAPFLFMSSQPFGLMQKAIVEAFIPKNSFELVANDYLVTHYKRSPSETVQIFLDLVARLTYQSLQNLENSATNACPSLGMLYEDREL